MSKSDRILDKNQHNDIVVSMIPPIDPVTGYLPPGLHDALWADIAPRFAANSHRSFLLSGFERACRVFAGAGCQSMLLDGSFISVKDLPGDYDAAWEPSGVDPDLLDPVLLDFGNKRAAMKAKYGGEFFPASAYAAIGVLFRDFFQKDRNGVPKGVLLLNLGSMT